MARAIWNDTVIAESDETILVEGNHYFPPEAVSSEFLVDSPEHSVCHWKGTASYYDVVVDGKAVRGGAWYYPDTTRRAKQIENHIAFWRGVRVEP